jgi:hypothetical protein
MDQQMTPDERTYSVDEIGSNHFNFYYRVSADGVEFPSTVYIMPSQKSPRTIEQLKRWCRRNSHLLAEGQVIQVDLPFVPRRGRLFSIFCLIAARNRWLRGSHFLRSLARNRNLITIDDRLRSIN